MSDSTKKNGWESLASELGISPTEVPPPPAPTESSTRTPEPASGTPSQVSMRPAPKASWQDLAEIFGIASVPAGAPPQERAPQSSPPPAPAQPQSPAINEPILLNPLAADTYKFEVIEETEIEFDIDLGGEATTDVSMEPRRDSVAPSEEGSEPSGERRRRRRRRRRGGRSDSAPRGDDSDANRRDASRPIAGRSAGVEEEPIEAELVDEVEPPLDEADLDAIEEAARREDLGLPPLSNRPAGPRRGRRRRRGRRGGSDRDSNRGREEHPRAPVPDGVAHGDEYDIIDDSADLPSSGDRPYGNDRLSDADDHADDDDHEHGDAEGDAGEPLESLHRNIHTWEQTVGTIIAKNMESRARSPGNPNARGRGGRPRGRGGRGRSGGGR